MNTATYSFNDKLLQDIVCILGIVEDYLKPSKTLKKESAPDLEAELLSALRDRQADKWLKMLQPAVERSILRLGVLYHDCEDIFQLAVEGLYKMIDQPNFKVRKSLKALLFRIAKFIALKWLDKIQKADKLKQKPNIPSTDGNQVLSDWDQSRLKAVKKAMSNLTEQRRNLLMWKHYYGLTYEDIVQKLNPYLFDPYNKKGIEAAINRYKGQVYWAMKNIKNQLGLSDEE